MRKQDKRWHTEPALWEKLKPLAREKRIASTEDETTLWKRLRNFKISGIKFRRQHTIGPFIVDFYCAQAGLVIEIDGPVHQYTAGEDAIQQEFLESYHLRVIRFTNEAVLNGIDKVLEKIVTCLSKSL